MVTFQSMHPKFAVVYVARVLNCDDLEIVNSSSLDLDLDAHYFAIRRQDPVTEFRSCVKVEMAILGFPS